MRSATAIDKIDQVFDLLQQVKAQGGEFRTNFFPLRNKLEGWIRRGELAAEEGERAVFFLRRDRDFLRLYFCAAGEDALARELPLLPCVNAERVVLDVVGTKAAVAGTVESVEAAGFRQYRHLERLARTGRPDAGEASAPSAQVTYAEREDASALGDLLDRSFDRYADQIPARSEIEEAVGERQITVVKYGATVAALLFFETQGFTSTIRYWAVDERFRAKRLGSALMRDYFTTQAAAKRFVLWVLTSNEDAVRKYQHFGYAPDGLVDQVLVNAALLS